MSETKDRLYATLERMADRMDSIEASQGQAKDLLIKMRAELTDLRGRVLDDADRTGGQVRRNAGAIQQLEGRVAHLEQAERDNGAAER